MLLRTAKSCGPDAPTLASSLAEVQPPNRVGMRPDIREATVAKEPGHRGSAKETVKLPSTQGSTMPKTRRLTSISPAACKNNIPTCIIH